MRFYRFRVAIVGALFLIGAIGCDVAAGCTATTAGLTAPGAPGSLSHLDLARKDCVGTAANVTSKVWYTVANGVLSDVYNSTVDNTNVETMQYVVTDGRSFTDLQTRDLTYTLSADPTGMACTVLATSAAHGYQLVTTYVADPARDAVVAHTTLCARRARHRKGYSSRFAWTPMSTATVVAARTTAAPTPR